MDDSYYYDIVEDNNGNAIVAQIATERQEKDDDVSSVVVQGIIKDARKTETLRRYFLQAGNSGSPIAAMGVTS
ncbi:hypothetical protein BgiMline_032632 [Biomphalaria glabrata]|nr:hypothetical protein BgiMline_015644 [Biomphalaria glabrata]